MFYVSLRQKTKSLDELQKKMKRERKGNSDEGMLFDRRVENWPFSV